MPDLRETIETVLKAFTDTPLRDAGLNLLSTLGYASDRTLDLDGSPEAFLEQFDSAGRNFSAEKALVTDWKRVDLLFQLTGEDLSGQSDLFDENKVKQGNLQSYLFFALELTGENYARGKLSQIARQINRLFSAPVMLLIKHKSDAGIPACDKQTFTSASDLLSIAVINRRPHKRDEDKDVLGKVTLIRNISLTVPHRGHLDILADFALPALEKQRKGRIDSFDALHAAWEEVFNVDLLNEKFYRELSSWYFWALQVVHFPHDELDHHLKKNDLFANKDKLREHDAKNLIRLLTRLLFVWFVKEKGLVPTTLFDPSDVAEKWLNTFDPEASETRYYKAILQNLFFATLNQSQGKREFRKSGRQHRNITNLMRYEHAFKDPQAFVEVVESVVPFMNGGLFECLDKPHPTLKGAQGGDVILYEDGFSDREDSPLSVPDFLFFGEERQLDLSDVLGDKKRGKEKVRGIISILNRYKFTIVENTPIDQEIALDPELLGKVFENLLASYNPETKTTARKQTGSFYTPRSIVEYMVDESIKAYLRKELCKACPQVSIDDAQTGLEILFAYTEREHAFSEEERMALIKAIDNCKILDPACGSGAFPVGILHKMEFILGKLDKNNQLWRDRQINKVDATITAAEEIEDSTIREQTLADLEAQKIDIQEAFDNNALGYGRKLYLIENCIYGVDIQSIATQVSKLRFFISLIVDQKVDKNRENFGIRPLPNLETKFVSADTLIRIEKPAVQGDLFENEMVKEWEKELKTVRHHLFGAKTPKTKRKYREQDKEIRERIAGELKKNGWSNRSAQQLADWDPYDQNASCPFFDPEWMFDLKGFDVVLGNPPYVQIQKFAKAQKDLWIKQGYQTYSATADIYCLFYERGTKLLSKGGHLCYITSNKWMRAGYGKHLRSFLKVDTTLLQIIDFGELPVFVAATDTAIMLVCKDKAFESHRFHTIMIKETTEIKNLVLVDSGRFSLREQSSMNDDGWVLEESSVLHLIEKLRSRGKPLKKVVSGRFYYGIKTGLNEAFVVNRTTRDELIAEHPPSAQILKPFVHGADAKRWSVDLRDDWLIYVPWHFPLHLDTSISGSSKTAEALFQENYPAVYKYLLRHKPKLLARNAAETGIRYEWYALQRWGAEYWREFNETKIIFNETSKELHAFIDETGLYTNKTLFMLISPRPKPLLAILLSRMMDWLFRHEFPSWGDPWKGGRIQFRGDRMATIPIANYSENVAAKLSTIVDQILSAKKDNPAADTSALEREIDQQVYTLYDLTPEEIAIVEGNTSE